MEFLNRKQKRDPLNIILLILFVIAFSMWLLSCSNEEIEDEYDCNCVRTEYIFIVIGEYGEGLTSNVECQEEVFLRDIVKQLPEGSDAYKIICETN